MSAALLADYKPLENMPAAEVLTMLEGADFHSPNSASRSGANAFTLRADVGMGDLCESISHRQNTLRAILLMLCSDEDTPAHMAGVIEAALMLAQESAGFHAALHHGVMVYGRAPPPKGGK
jgi:hypothetical protein